LLELYNNLQGPVNKGFGGLSRESNAPNLSYYRNLWKRFGRHDALQGLSFTAPEGSGYALIGANGAGKTTTIKILVNILQPRQLGLC